MITFNVLKKINVNNHTEKKGNLTYLSWAWAVDQLLSNDPAATWEYKEPKQFNDTLMVFCSVTAFGKTMTAQLPVLDYKNKAVVNPDAMAVNTAMQRCLAKAIALHGIGLYIYAGEDVPQEQPASDEEINQVLEAINESESIESLKEIFKEAQKRFGSQPDVITTIRSALSIKKTKLEE
jgi:hypothetical protein